ncbi:Mur ligase family protein [Stella sp.]|uniref:Mur ligase family protein n=1 Tax=Stella sp. TaxID=2912054 RepID=UPI0035AFD8F1
MSHLRILGTHGFAGPNHIRLAPIVMMAVDFGPWAAAVTSARSAAFRGRLQAAMPAAWAALDPAATTAPLPDLAAAMAVAAQRAEHAAVDWWASRPATGAGRVELMTGYEEPMIAVAALRWAVVAVDAAIAAETGVASSADPEAARRQFLEALDTYQLVHTTRMQIREAERRGIPHHRLFPLAPVIQFGHGARQQRVVAASTSRTSHIGQSIASDKVYTSRLLAEAGLPVPKQQPVWSLREATEAAAAIGYPVVVKAGRVDKGEAVAAGLAGPEEVEAAYRRLHRHGRLLVEKHVPGADHRCLVVGGRVVAAARRIPAHVVGDGRHSVAELIDAANRSPRRATGDRSPDLVTIAVDDVVRGELRRQRLDLDSVPADGRIVALRATANISTGGTSIDVTDRLHPDTRRAVETAARVLDLDIAGVDVITTDIGRPLAETGGAICEVNQTPGLRPHVADPASPDAAAALVDHLFPDGGDGRIPLAAVTGTNGKTTTVRMAARILRAMGRNVGQATTETVQIDEHVLARGDLAGPPGARMLLQDPLVETAVVEVARGGLRRLGLGFDRCHVGAVLNVGDDHVGTDGIASREELADIKSLIVRVATDLAVLNARDPLSAAMRDRTPARQTCFVSTDPTAPLVAGGLPPGDIAATLRGSGGDATLVLRIDGSEVPLARVDALPAADGGRAMHNVENALFAAAIAWGLGATTTAIAEGLAGFDLGWDSTLGRMSVIGGLPFRLVVDYGHNADAIAAMRAWSATQEVSGRRICLLNAPGNRRNQHYPGLAAAAAGGFDHYVCSDPDKLRGRRPGEVASRLAQGLVGAGVPRERVAVVPAEAEAVGRILDRAGPGDLVVLFCHDPARAHRLAEARRSARA